MAKTSKYKRAPYKSLETDAQLDKHLKCVKVGETNTSLELSSGDNGARVNGDFNVKGDLEINGKLVTSGGGASGLVTGQGASVDIESADDIKFNSTTGTISFWHGNEIRNEMQKGDSGYNLKLYPEGATSGATDFSSLTAMANGKLLVGTTSSNQADIELSTLKGDIVLDSADDIILDSHDGQFLMKVAGTEFSAANSAYAGMIIGYSRLRGDDTNFQSYEIQNALTVEDSTHQITFITPPSENVEIECQVHLAVLSTDTEIHVGLSDNATYNSIGGQFEYDVDGIFFSDDEADKHTKTFKFVLGASELASVGSSNTFYIGFGTAGVTKAAYIQYGFRASHGLAYPPFVIKATALPVAIYDGQ